MEKNQHSCDQEVLVGVAGVCHDMSLALQERAVKDLAVPPAVRWQQVFDAFHAKHPSEALQGIPRTKGVTIIKNVRQGATGGDGFRAIESAPLRCVSELNPRPFLQFSICTPPPSEWLAFAHPDLVCNLRYPQLTLFINETFSVVPKGSSQCLIAMVYDTSVDVYLPLYYVLVDTKKQDTYWRVLEQLIIASDRMLEPRDVTCDFELALIKAVIEQFPRANIVGCLFHWKQALRRKMLDLKISRERIAYAMKPGKLDVLTVVPADEELDKACNIILY